MIRQRLVSCVGKKVVLFRHKSVWNKIKLAAPDKILGLTESFNNDLSSSKINLGVGAYRDDNGKPYVLDAVRTAELRILSRKTDKEYTGIGGVSQFVEKAVKFAYGETCEAVLSNRVAAVQSISGTGACRLAGELVKKFFTDIKSIYLPNPTWGNHDSIYRSCNLQPQYYKYYDVSTRKLDFEGMLRDVNNAPNGSLFLLHACAHNPTGCDPSPIQWNELSKCMKDKQHMALFDNAYQGFASGNPDTDAYSFRRFVEDGHHIMLCQSFAKNFGLYGERVGTLSVVTASKEEAVKVDSQLKLLVRAMYSSPPIHGARIVAEVLSDPQLTTQWYAECRAMASRIQEMRFLLRGKLEALGGKEGEWAHLTDQIGMFCFTGLSAEQVRLLREEFHIYCTEDGRFSIAGVNTHNVDYLASSVHSVVSATK